MAQHFQAVGPAFTHWYKGLKVVQLAMRSEKHIERILLEIATLNRLTDQQLVRESRHASFLDMFRPPALPMSSHDGSKVSGSLSMPYWICLLNSHLNNPELPNARWAATLLI